MQSFFALAYIFIILGIGTFLVEGLKLIQKREIKRLQYEIEDALEHSEANEQTVKDISAKLEQYREATKEYKQQVFNMAIDTMERQGYIEAVRRQGTMLSTKDRRKLAYSIAEPYAIDYPCNVQNYVPQLADALIASLEEHMEMFAQERNTERQPVQRPQPTTGRMMPLAGTMLQSIVNPHSAQYDMDGSTEKTRRHMA